MKKAVLGLAIVLILGVGTSTSYSKDNCMYYASIENDQYGAVNLEIFDKMQFALRDGNQNSINEMLKKNQVKKIVTEKKVCVLSEAFYKYASRISIPGFSKEYLVDNSKLSKVE
jgi:hypothetical protein